MQTDSPLNIIWKNQFAFSLIKKKDQKQKKKNEKLYVEITFYWEKSNYIFISISAL